MIDKDFDGKERRQHKRILFTPERMIKGVFSIGAKDQKTVTYKIADLGMGGLRFIVPRQDADTIQSDTPVFLLTIEGELNVAFERPVALNVRWIVDEPAFQFVMVGCAFYALGKSAAGLLQNVVEAELLKFEKGT